MLALIAWVVCMYMGTYRDNKTTHQFTHRPGCPDYIHSEVACDFNAGWSSAVAALKHLSMQGLHF